MSLSEPPKVVGNPSVFNILTWNCASRHNGVHFSKLDISDSKSGPNMVCFGHSDFEICFAPQRRALFRNSTSQTPKVVRTWCVLCILTWKCASRHNGVRLSNIRTSKSGANMWCFVHFDLEMCFAPQRRALFDIATSKSGPAMVCFVHFDFKMCFAPQRRALFRHRNFQKWSGHGVFCTF